MPKDLFNKNSNEITRAAILRKPEKKFGYFDFGTYQYHSIALQTANSMGTSALVYEPQCTLLRISQRLWKTQGHGHQDEKRMTERINQATPPSSHKGYLKLYMKVSTLSRFSPNPRTDSQKTANFYWQFLHGTHERSTGISGTLLVIVC